MSGRRAGSGGGKYNAESAKKAANGSTLSSDDGLLLTVHAAGLVSRVNRSFFKAKERNSDSFFSKEQTPISLFFLRATGANRSGRSLQKCE